MDISLCCNDKKNEPQKPCNNDDPNSRLNKFINSVPKYFGEMTSNNFEYMRKLENENINLCGVLTKINVHKCKLENENIDLLRDYGNLVDEIRELRTQNDEVMDDYRKLLGDYFKLVKDESKPMKDNLSMVMMMMSDDE